MHEQCVCDLLRAIFSWCLNTWVLRLVYLVHVLGIIGISSVCTASWRVVNRRCSIWPRNAQMRWLYSFLLYPVNHIRAISNCLSISFKDILHFRTNFEVMTRIALLLVLMAAISACSMPQWSGNLWVTSIFSCFGKTPIPTLFPDLDPSV